MNQFPRLYQYTNLLSQRDSGILLVVFLVIIGAGLLVDGRAYWPRLLAWLRVGIVALFYGLAFFVVGFKVIFH